MLEASLMSSVLGLNVTPKKVIILFFKFLFNIFTTLLVNNNFLFSLDLTTFLTIDKSILNLFAVSIKALVSFGKHDPP